MTRAQKKKALAVIRSDATACTIYCNKKGQTCVIGGLLRKAGWSDKMLRALRSLSIDFEVGEILLAKKTLLRVYGIGDKLACGLQMINDCTNNLSRRRKALTRAIDAA